jgi:uncharacterized protein (TIGR03437 family)
VPTNRFLTLFLISLTASAAADRITRPIDSGRTTALSRPKHPLATAAADRGAVAPDMALEGVTILFQPGPGLETLLAAQQRPGSPDYRRWLTAEQFGDRFGLSAADLKKVTVWLESYGLHIDRTARGRHWITFSGSASAVGRAFGTTFHQFEVEGALHYATIAAPRIPEALEGVVAGFIGLDDLPIGPPRPVPIPLANIQGGTHAMSPDDFATIYNVTPLYNSGVTGSGQRIAVVGQSSFDVNDIRLFRRTFGLTPSDPVNVLVGKEPGVTPAAMETVLDIEAAGGVARNAQIVYVYASSFVTALAYAADNNVAPVISVSFNGCEAYLDTSFRAVVQQANAQGITVVAGSGDWGAATCDQISSTPQASRGLTVGIPASFPEVTAIGGTQFNEGSGRYWNTTQTINLSSAISYIPETVWNDTGLVTSLKIASGGGPSAIYAKPYWQSAPGVPDDGARDIPDISLAASYVHDGYLIVYQGTLYSAGGTSAGTPAFAGVVALLSQALLGKGTISQPGLGNLNPTLYRLARNTPSIFHDIVAGNNSVPCVQGSPGCVEGQLGFSAGPGYDLATGIGTIDVQRLIGAWDLGFASKTTVSADPSPAGLADKVTLTASVTGSAGSAPGGTVTFLVPTSGDNVIGATALLKTGDGSATAAITVDASAVIGSPGGVAALYDGDGVYAASSGTVTVGAKAPDSGSMVVVFVAPSPSGEVAGMMYWPVYITLSEKAGVSTTLTAASFNGNSVLSYFGSGNVTIPANGSIGASFGLLNVNPPADVTFHFAGRDASGATWSRDVVQHFVGPPGVLPTPGVALVSAPTNVVLNPNADSACQWSHQLVVRETGGFLTQITSLRQGTTDLSANIQQLFGTTRLAPYGSLTANICLPGGATRNLFYTITGSSDTAVTVSANVTVSYAGAATPATSLAVTPASLTLNAPDATGVLQVQTAAQWSVSVLPVKPDWLTLSPSGNGVTVSAVTAGLSHGAYSFMIVVQSPSGLPQSINVPLTIVVGGSSRTTIAGVANGASFTTNFAPGMVLSVFGNGLAPSVQTASALPLPLSLAGVSATVDGVSAPLYFVSPGQLNVQVPYETTLGPTTLALNNNGQVAVFPFNVSVAAPGIFVGGDGGLAPNPTGARGQSLLAFVTGDGDVSPTLATGATPSTSVAVSNLPKPRLPVSITIGGVNAPIAFVGVPYGLSGVTQINFTVPDGAPSGDQPVVVTVGGVASKPAKLTVQ